MVTVLLFFRDLFLVTGFFFRNASELYWNYLFLEIEKKIFMPKILCFELPSFKHCTKRTDVTKAFDCLSHELITAKLNAYGLVLIY